MTNDFADFIINLFSPSGFGSILGWLLVLLVAFYLVFAFLLIRQVAIKNKSVITPYAPLFTIFAWVHFFAAVVIFLLALASF